MEEYKLMLRFVFKYVLILVFFLTFAGHSKAETNGNESAQDGKLLTCFVYSLQTIPLLKQLQLRITQNSNEHDTKELIEAIGGRDKVEIALIDSEIVLEKMANLVSERHIIKLDEKLFDNPMWILSNELYDHSMKEKSFNQRFLETFRFTQSCIDEFMKKAPNK
jgi:hypothetical protein